MSNDQGKETVVIHIDKQQHRSPTPTTGVALYSLGGIKPGFVMFKEVHGHGDDEKVPSDRTSIELKNGDHFYSAKDELNPGND